MNTDWSWKIGGFCWVGFLPKMGRKNEKGADKPQKTIKMRLLKSSHPDQQQKSTL